MMLPVTKPTIPDIGRYMKYVAQANARAWLTNFGPLHEELTDRLKAWLGVDHLLLVANGTLALQVAYRALDLSGPVLTTPFSFVATTSSLHWEGLAPRFADIHRESLNLDPAAAASASEFGGIVAVHVYGNPCDVEGLEHLARKRKVPLIYDAAHAFGSRFDGQSVLRWGDASTLSFHATKLFHTIEGGAIVFREAQHLERARKLVNFGMNGGEPDEAAGLNAKLSEYQAAAGLVLLETIDEILEKRAALVHEYRRQLDGWVSFPCWNPRGEITGAYMPMLLRDEAQCLSVRDRLAQAKIGSRRYFHPSLNLVGADGAAGQCPVSEEIAPRILCLPLYTDLAFDEVTTVCEQVKAALGEGVR